MIHRSAGMLMHITSLPSSFGIGDLGPEAFAFADFLHRTKQSFWQILPLNPVDESQAFSPYSSHSGMAGNTLLISPEQLVRQGLLTQEESTLAKIPAGPKINFTAAQKIKESLLAKAYQRWLTSSASQHAQLKKFATKHDYWLRDFALFTVLKQLHQQSPWYEWPKAYKHRESTALNDLKRKQAARIREICWQQMIFHQQWDELRTYCNRKGIGFIGDLPFYVSRDSADVWANRSVFTVTAEGDLTGVAGVPPDAFNDDGQLWGMPVYNWKSLAKQDYAWWISRLRKNLALFDIVRLDHFRALASYWVVPAKAKKATKGEWKKAPGERFLEKVSTALKGLPFIAEDLGEIEEDVYALRDAFELPGMNVLQFAFGKDMPVSPYIPHHNMTNSVIYTGTHDNNTTRGWYRHATDTEKKNIASYCGAEVNDDNICQLMIRLAYSSVSSLAIIPVQDILGLDEEARMNTPAGGNDNWSWRIGAGKLNKDVSERVVRWCEIYDRVNKAS